jgi:hypothetical protein
VRAHTNTGSLKISLVPQFRPLDRRGVSSRPAIMLKRNLLITTRVAALNSIYLAKLCTRNADRRLSRPLTAALTAPPSLIGLSRYRGCNKSCLCLGRCSRSRGSLGGWEAKVRRAHCLTAQSPMTGILRKKFIPRSMKRLQNIKECESKSPFSAHEILSL